MKKIFLAAFVLMSFACSDGVALCNKAAACNDEISDADTERCIENARERDEELSNYNNEDCDAAVEAEGDYNSCLNSTGECSDGRYQTSQCDDEFERFLEESVRVVFEDCDG